jgi:hypothetical protein
MKAKTLSLFIAALLVLSIAGTAQAQVWSITLTPIPAKKQGDRVDFTGTVTKDGVGQPNVFVLIVVTNPLGSTTGPGSYQNAVTTDATGRYSDFYQLPPDAPLGTYTVTVSATSEA